MLMAGIVNICHPAPVQSFYGRTANAMCQSPFPTHDSRSQANGPTCVELQQRDSLMLGLQLTPNKH